MEAQITDIATTAGRALLNPALLAVPLVGGLALVTGAAARVIEFVEYHSAGRSHRPD